MDNKDNWNLRLLKDEYERQDQRMFRWADHIDKMARLQKLQAIAMFVIAGFMLAFAAARLLKTFVFS